MSVDQPRDIETLAREEPQAVREVADMAGDELREWLLAQLEAAEDGGANG